MKFCLRLGTTLSMICLYVFSFAQVSVQGIVSDVDNLPLIGVTVVEKGTTNGVITDFDGSYTLNVANSESVLVFTFIGLSSKEVPIGGQSSINVVLLENTNLIDEVVVVGYGTQKRSNISGAVSVVSSEEIKETPATRIEQAIQGRTAGVQVTQNSGSPGSALTVRIRGAGTILNSDPLYIVDGIIVGGLDFLNINDVETISILKDAASSAIYGARASNGVVLITTKSGSTKSKGSVSYEAYYGSQSAAKQVDLLNAREYAVISNESYINAGRTPIVNLQDPSVFNEGTDWQRAIYQNAPILSHNLSMNGGGKGFSIGASGSYFLQDGIVGGDKARFKRYTGRTVMSYDVKPWLKVGSNVAFTNLTRNAVQENNEFTSPIIHALNMDPLTPDRKPNGTYAYSDFVDTDIRNPLHTIDNTNDQWTTNRVIAAAIGEVKFSEALKFKSTYSVDITFANSDIFIPRYDLSIDTTFSDAPAPERNNVNTVALTNFAWKNWQWENLAMYDKTFGAHTVGVIGGVSANFQRAEGSGGANTNLPTNDPEDAYISNTIDPIGSQSAFEYAEEVSFLSYIGRVNYTYADKYLFTGSFRADGSSKFGANKRFGYFPAVSLGWIINREDFFNYDPISLLKLRASYGRNGNDRIGNYGFTSTVLNGQNYTFGASENITNGAVALTVANPDLQWETTIQTNFGLDVEMLDGKFNFSTDYYIKKTEDMLYRAPVLSVVGAISPVVNIGEVLNSGIEFLFQYRDKIGAIDYELGTNLAFTKNEVTFLGGGDPQFSGGTFVQGLVAKTDVGHPIASFYGYETDGIFQDQSEINSHAFQSEGTSPGDIRFKDLNGDGVVNDDDKTYIGNPTPDAVFGFNARVDYKSFDFSTFFQGVYGNEIFNASVRYDKIGGNRPASILDRWTGPGTSNIEPKVSLLDPNRNNRASDRFIEDGSFLRLKNVQIGYSLDLPALKKADISKLRFYISGQNLWTFTNYSGYDPEIGSRSTDNPLEIGIDRGFYPSARTILGGIQINF